MVDNQRADGRSLIPDPCVHTVRTASECCQRCQVMPGCVAWSFAKHNHTECPGGCWLIGAGEVQSVADGTHVAGIPPVSMAQQVQPTPVRC